MLFKVLKPGGIFVIEEIDFPEKKLDMRQDQHPPDLKSILKNILSQKEFFSNYIKESN